MRKSKNILSKVVSLTLAFIVMLSASGFSINKHYCKNKLMSVKLSLVANDKSCCGNKKMPKGCCKNKIEVIKIKDDFTQSTYCNVSVDHSILLALLNTESSLFNMFNSEVKPSFSSNSSPPKLPVSLNILYRSIQI